MKTLKFLVRRSGLLVVITSVSLCTGGCAAPLVALGTSAAGAGMQALGGATGAAGMEALGNAAGAAGMQMLGDKVGDYMQGGEQLADVTYWTRPALLKKIVNQTLRETVSSSFVALRYGRSHQDGEGLFVLSTSTGNELRIVVKEDSSFDDLHAAQMIVDMETVEVASRESETAEFVNVLQEIDSETQRYGIEQIRGDFNYAAALTTSDSEQTCPEQREGSHAGFLASLKMTSGGVA